MKKKIIFTLIFIMLTILLSSGSLLLNKYSSKFNFFTNNFDEPTIAVSDFSPKSYDNPYKKITISFAGDCTFGRSQKADYAHSFDQVYDNNGDEYFFSNVSEIFAQDSLTIVNFEGTLTDDDNYSEKQFSFKGNPDYANILKAGSIEAVTLANNHSYDYGEIGYQDTKNNLQKYDIAFFGNESTRILTCDGVKIGLIGLQAYNDYKEHRDYITASHQKLIADGADFTILYFHWGTELNYTQSDYQISLARFAIDSGIETVVGAHPHVISPIEIYNGHTIAYSLGNFSFGGNTNPTDKDSIILQLAFTMDDKNTILERQHTTIPVSISSVTSINDYKPTPVLYSKNPDDFRRIISKIGLAY